MLISEITKKDIEDVCLMNLNRYDLKKKAFLSMRGIIKAVFKYAYAEYWIADNPYERIDFSRYKDMIIRPVDIGERAYSEESLSQRNRSP